ncbi:MAG: CHASE4 domain-containing protein, partial [Devosia sp.]|nr:CHASE4 domain-containing protein [Devosia sp.]
MAKGPRQLAVQPSEQPAAPVVRPLPFGEKPLRTFALVIGLPAFLLYVASATLVIFVLSMMASEINRLEDSRGVRSMHAALDSFLNGLGDAVAGEGTWTEAHLNTVVKPDPAWMDTTWGAAARRGLGYDTVLVTDQAGTIQFGENNLGALTGNIGIHFPAARTMLRDLDRGISATGDATVESRFAADQSGTVGLAAISIHRSNSTGLSVSKQSRRILWIARHVTPSLLQDFAARFQTPLAVLTAIVDPDSSSIDLTDADGKVTGTVAWTPDRPGDIAFAHALRIASAVFFGIGLLLVIGLGLLRRAMLRRAAPEVAIALGDAAASADEASATVSGAAPAIAEDPTLNSPIDGITASDFEVEYQPIFDLRAETLIGVEALLRWKKPDKTPLLQETLPPALCAALLDRAGLIAIRHAVGEIAPL